MNPTEIEPTSEPKASAEVFASEAAAEPPARPDITDVGKFLAGPRTFPVYAVVGIFLMGVVSFLYFARAFFLPLVLAIMLSFLLRPVVKALARFNVPEALGAGLVLAVALFVLGHGVSRLTQPAAQWLAQAPESLRNVERKFHELLRPAHQLNQAASEVEGLAKGPEGQATPKVEVKQSALADALLSRTTSFVAGAIETVVLLFFLLAAGDRLMQKLVKVLPTLHNKKRAVTIAHEVQSSISTFLFTTTLINACVGVIVASALYFIGMPNPVLWGVLAGVLNFIPYFGPFTGVLVLLLAGLLTYDRLGQSLTPPLIYLGIHALESNFITPMILGRRLTLSPLLIFASLMFWTWLWGIPGALLSVPLLMTLKIFCDHFKPLASLGELLSG